MTAAVILYAFMAVMLYASIMGAFRRPKRKHPPHAQEETHV